MQDPRRIEIAMANAPHTKQYSKPTAQPFNFSQPFNLTSRPPPNRSRAPLAPLAASPALNARHSASSDLPTTIPSHRRPCSRAPDRDKRPYPRSAFPLEVDSLPAKARVKLGGKERTQREGLLHRPLKSSAGSVAVKSLPPATTTRWPPPLSPKKAAAAPRVLLPQLALPPPPSPPPLPRSPIPVNVSPIHHSRPLANSIPDPPPSPSPLRPQTIINVPFLTSLSLSPSSSFTSDNSPPPSPTPEPPFIPLEIYSSILSHLHDLPTLARCHQLSKLHLPLAQEALWRILMVGSVQEFPLHWGWRGGWAGPKELPEWRMLERDRGLRELVKEVVFVERRKGGENRAPLPEDFYDHHFRLVQIPRAARWVNPDRDDAEGSVTPVRVEQMLRRLPEVQSITLDLTRWGWDRPGVSHFSFGSLGARLHSLSIVTRERSYYGDDEYFWRLLAMVPNLKHLALDRGLNLGVEREGEVQPTFELESLVRTPHCRDLGEAEDFLCTSSTNSLRHLECFDANRRYGINPSRFPNLTSLRATFTTDGDFSERDAEGVEFLDSLHPLHQLQHLHLIAEEIPSPGTPNPYLPPTSTQTDLNHPLLLAHLPPSISHLQLSIQIDPPNLLSLLRKPKYAPQLKQLVLSLGDLGVSSPREKEEWRNKIERMCERRGMARVRWVASVLERRPREGEVVRAMWDDEDEEIAGMDEEEREEYLRELEEEAAWNEEGSSSSEEEESEGSEVGDW